MKLGFLGLGKMGKRIVIKLLEDGHEVVVWNRSLDVVEEFVQQVENLSLREFSKGERVEKFQENSSQLHLNNIITANTIQDFTQKLDTPRVLWVMVSPGRATEEVLEEIKKYVEAGDIVIDGGNAFYQDTERRSKELKARSIKFLGIGVSGGIIAPTNGFPLMVGGDKSAYEYILPILTTLAKPHGGYEYFGNGGVGHYIKMVHNGIEYGMMQAIGEGFGILDKGPYELALNKVANLWTKGTIISGFLLDRTKEVLEKDPTLSKIVGEIDSTGEGEWTINEAKKLGVSTPVIEKSYEFRLESKRNPTVAALFAARMVAGLRNAFGGHRVKELGSRQKALGSKIN